MEIVFTNQAAKDFEKIKQFPSLLAKVTALLNLISENPFENPPAYEKLMGFENTYSRRINIHHRLVYQVYKNEQTIKIIRMWTHYEWWKVGQLPTFSFAFALICLIILGVSYLNLL